MKTLALAAALLASPAAAQRALPTETLALQARSFEGLAFVPEVTDAFAHLAGLFDKGVALKREEVEGWRAGRLYHDYAPSVSRSAILIGEVLDNVAEGGPVFGASFKLVSMTAHDANAGVFDEIDAKETKWIRDTLIQEAARADAPVFTATGVVFEVPGALRVETRKSGDFLVSRHVDGSGKIIAYSYYFLVVTPKK